jgi:hypothetical protein
LNSNWRFKNKKRRKQKRKKEKGKGTIAPNLARAAQFLSLRVAQNSLSPPCADHRAPSGSHSPVPLLTFSLEHGTVLSAELYIMHACHCGLGPTRQSTDRASVVSFCFSLTDGTHLSLYLFLAAHLRRVVELATPPLTKTASHLDFKSGPRTLLLSPLSPLLLSPQEKGKRHRRRRAKVAADENCPTFLPSFKKAPGWFRVDAPRTSDASRVEIHDRWRWNFSPSI